MPRRFPNFFEAMASALDYRPPVESSLPGLTPEQADFPRGERDQSRTGDPRPAPWIDGPLFAAGDSRVEFALGSEVTDLAPQPDLGILGWLEQGAHQSWSTDFVAAYVPWHLHGNDWGIRIHGPALEALVVFIANCGGGSVRRLRRIVLEQVLRHEWSHFAVEVLAGELQLQARRVFYPGYFEHRYGQAPAGGLPGPIEEVVASYREVAFARGRLQPGLGPKPTGYLEAVKASLRISGSGYRDWALMDRATTRPLVTAAHLELLTGVPGGATLPRRLARLAAGVPTPTERAQVRLSWLGDPALMPAYGAVPKVDAPPTIRELERWLRHIGATIDTRGGKGSHRKAKLPNGRSFVYAAGHRILLRPEAKQLARKLEIGGLTDVYRHVANLSLPRSLAGRETPEPTVTK